MSRDCTLETEFGVVLISATDGNHLFIRPCVDSTSHGESFIEVNGVDYHMTLHLFRDPSRVDYRAWLTSKDQGWGVRDYRDLYMSRWRSDKKVSEAARRKVLDKLVGAVVEWLATDEGQDAIAWAAAVAAQREVDRLEREIEEAEDKLRDLKREYRQAKKDLKAKEEEAQKLSV